MSSSDDIITDENNSREVVGNASGEERKSEIGEGKGREKKMRTKRQKTDVYTGSVLWLLTIRTPDCQ